MSCCKITSICLSFAAKCWRCFTNALMTSRQFSEDVYAFVLWRYVAVQIWRVKELFVPGIVASTIKLSKIFQRLAFKHFPAICFQKAFKFFPAISFQNISSDLLSKFWTLRDGENLKAHCFQNFVNENSITNSRFLLFESNFASFQNFASSVAFKN